MSELNNAAGMDLSVVLPVYNEVENVTPLVKKTLAVLAPLGKRCEIILVDDGCTDGTDAVLDRLAA